MPLLIRRRSSWRERHGSGIFWSAATCRRFGIINRLGRGNARLECTYTRTVGHWPLSVFDPLLLRVFSGRGLQRKPYRSHQLMCCVGGFDNLAALPPSDWLSLRLTTRGWTSPAALPPAVGLS